MHARFENVEIALSVAGNTMALGDHGLARTDDPAVEGQRMNARYLVADIDPAASLVHMDVHRMIEASPLGQIGAVGVEQLHPVVFAVAHEQSAIGERFDAVGSREMSGVRAGATPAMLETASRRKAVHHRVAVAVRNVDVTVWRLNCVGRMVERSLKMRLPVA